MRDERALATARGPGAPPSRPAASFDRALRVSMTGAPGSAPRSAWRPVGELALGVALRSRNSPEATGVSSTPGQAPDEAARASHAGRRSGRRVAFHDDHPTCRSTPWRSPPSNPGLPAQCAARAHAPRRCGSFVRHDPAHRGAGRSEAGALRRQPEELGVRRQACDRPDSGRTAGRGGRPRSPRASRRKLLRAGARPSGRGSRRRNPADDPRRYVRALDRAQRPDRQALRSRGRLPLPRCARAEATQLQTRNSRARVRSRGQP